jgi:hypothetical protein
VILAQNKLQPQEEIDENGNCGRLPTKERIYAGRIYVDEYGTTRS